MSSRPRPSAVIVRLSSLGDVALALPLAGLLDARGYRVGWIVEAAGAELLRHAPWPIEILVWRRGVRSLLALRGAGRGYTVALDVQGNWKSGWVASMLGAGTVVGLAREDVREGGNLLFTERRAARARASHVTERSLGVVAAALGEPLRRSELPGRPWLVPSPAGRARVERQLAELGAGAAPLVLVAGSHSDPRSWPLAHVVSAARALPDRALVLLGPGEQALELPAGIRVLRHARAALPELIALGAVLRERNGVAVGHDCGAMHVLHASGAPAVFLFGSQDPQRTGPLGGQVLLAPQPLECRPCLRRVCTREEGAICMSGISVPQVLAAI